ncbi:DDB1- and CUL4-associated factor 8-like [Iris pallida]|uniref:DDB1- and CUL4-associated factor 8-like n=1 Tax=Iris pallida TaxID=29817 RepID=A0AAX6HHS2_IRIPA|nr:DDB1- and CUL4-associated factor 8-like [Iris pallida]
MMEKKERSSSWIVDICRREVGVLSPRSFALRSAASEDLVLRLGIHRKLNRHTGCVNTVSFNADGNILLSGSDDKMIVLWDWEFGKVKTLFHTGHTDNVFQARFMPYTNDRTIVTCGGDGEVRHTQILESGEGSTMLLAEHEGRAHKLAIEPGSPHIFYSCGEDGLVQHFDLRTQSATKIIMCKSFEKKTVYRPIVRLHAITIDPRNPNLIAIAGSEEYARIYDIRKYKCGRSSDFDHPIDCFCPPHLIGDESLGITGLAFSGQSELLVSYNDESIYLFSKDLGLGPSPAIPSDIGSPSRDMDMSSVPQVYKGHRNMDTVKGVGFFGPNYEYVVSGSDCGRVFIWRKKDGELLRVMEGDLHVVNCIEPHPYATMFASSGIENDIKIWTPNSMERAPPVNMDELRKPRSRANFCRFAFPEDLVASLLEQRRQDSSQQGSREDSERSADLFELLINSMSSEDSSERGASEGPGDCIVS